MGRRAGWHGSCRQRGMTVDEMTLLAGVYIVGAVILSLVVAYRLNSRLPGNRPYMWGFFFGCVCIACVPLVVASAVETVVAFSRERWVACHLHGICTVVFALTTVCGWFIVRRRGWAWLLGSLLGPVCAFPVLQDLLGWMVANVGYLGGIVWAINYAYGRNRWGEFYGVAPVPAPDADKAAELEMGNCRLPVAN